MENQKSFNLSKMSLDSEEEEGEEEMQLEFEKQRVKYGYKIWHLHAFKTIRNGFEIGSAYENAQGDQGSFYVIKQLIRVSDSENTRGGLRSRKIKSDRRAVKSSIDKCVECKKREQWSVHNRENTNELDRLQTWWDLSPEDSANRKN